MKHLLPLAKHCKGALLSATLAFMSQSANKQLLTLSPWRWRYFRCIRIIHHAAYDDMHAHTTAHTVQREQQ
jgi:hypothetical protein